jgi:hypothetical protein
LKFEVQSFFSLSEEGSNEARKQGRASSPEYVLVGKGFEEGQVVATGERIRSSFLSFVFEL